MSRTPPFSLLEPSSSEFLLRTVVGEWAWIFLLWAGMISLPAIALPLLVILCAGRFNALGVILHDLCHAPVSCRTWREALLEWMSGFPLGTTLEAMRYHHLRHHRNYGTVTDPYFRHETCSRTMSLLVWFPRGLLLAPFWLLRVLVGTIASFVPVLVPAYARFFLQDRVWPDKGALIEARTCAKAERPLLLFLLAVHIVGWQFPQTFFLAYVLPILGVGILAGLRLMLEHGGTSEGQAVDHRSGPLLRAVLFPLNVGYHLTHHRYPEASLRHLPALNTWTLAELASTPATTDQEAHSSTDQEARDRREEHEIL